MLYILLLNGIELLLYLLVIIKFLNYITSVILKSTRKSLSSKVSRLSCVKKSNITVVTDF